jgi:hypothetical protein
LKVAHAARAPTLLIVIGLRHYLSLVAAFLSLQFRASHHRLKVSAMIAREVIAHGRA